MMWNVRCVLHEHTLPCVLGRADPADQNTMCSITHEHIATADVPGLPQLWRVDGNEYDSIRIQCGHTFHTSTLMLHFLLNNMRCPVCRHGVAVKASIDSVPASVVAGFRDKLSEIQERVAADDLGAWHVILAESLEDCLRLVVEVHCVHNVTVMSSRLTHDEADPAQPEASHAPHHVFRAQQSL